MTPFRMNPTRRNNGSNRANLGYSDANELYAEMRYRTQPGKHGATHYNFTLSRDIVRQVRPSSFQDMLLDRGHDDAGLLWLAQFLVSRERTGRLDLSLEGRYIPDTRYFVMMMRDIAVNAEPGMDEFALVDTTDGKILGSFFFHE